MSGIGSYFRTLTSRFGSGWNRFWFAPRDPIALGVIRILTAAVALALYLTYFPDLERLFGPSGLLSREAMIRLRDNIPAFSMFDYAANSTTLWCLYWAGAAAIAAMLVGLLTRVTAVLALVSVLSLIYRGPMLARPVDEIVAMLMFYLCLGPCGRTLSLDAWLHRSNGAIASRALSSSAATISTRLIQVHLSAIYFAMVFAKLRGSINTGVWWDGTAVWDLMARPEYPLVDFTRLGLSDAGWYLINIWTTAILAFELCFAVLIWNRLARPLLLGLSVVMWIGTAVLTGMVSFAVIMLVAGLAFVSPAAFRKLLQRSAVEPDANRESMVPLRR